MGRKEDSMSVKGGNSGVESCKSGVGRTWVVS